MKNTYKYLLLLVVIAALVLVISSFSKNTSVNAPSDEVIATAMYVDDSGRVIPAEYTDGKVTILNLDGEIMTLNQVISASGARYANDDESFVFWNKGDDVTVYVNDEVVFEGTDTQALGNEQTEEVLPEEGSKSYLGSWEWAETVYPTDEGGAAPQPKSDKFVLTLNEDGTVQGTTDCNNFSGSYTVDNGTISFGDGFASTLKYCEGSQEAEFISLLQKVQSIFQPDTSNLVLELPLDSGQVIFKKK